VAGPGSRFSCQVGVGHRDLGGWPLDTLVPVPASARRTVTDLLSLTRTGAIDGLMSKPGGMSSQRGSTSTTVARLEGRGHRRHPRSHPAGGRPSNDLLDEEHVKVPFPDSAATSAFTARRTAFT